MSEIVQADREVNFNIETLTYCSGYQPSFGGFRIEMLLKRDVPGIELQF